MGRWREVSESLSIVMFWVYGSVSRKVPLCVPGTQQGARKCSPCSDSRLRNRHAPTVPLECQIVPGIYYLIYNLAVIILYSTAVFLQVRVSHCLGFIAARYPRGIIFDAFWRKTN